MLQDPRKGNFKFQVVTDKVVMSLPIILVASASANTAQAAIYHLSESGTYSVLWRNLSSKVTFTHYRKSESPSICAQTRFSDGCRNCSTSKC